jgi:hypothetical protein
LVVGVFVATASLKAQEPTPTPEPTPTATEEAGTLTNSLLCVLIGLTGAGIATRFIRP